MEYFKCCDCYRIYEYPQLVSGNREACDCGSYRFRESTQLAYDEAKAMEKMLEKAKNEKAS